MKRKQLMVALALAVTVPSAMASGFALIEQSASGQGLSYAGAAANAEDASVMWFNAAGLTEIEGNQAIAGAHAIVPSNDFSDKGSSLNGALPLSGDDDPSTTGFVPNLYWKGDYDDYAVGFGVNVPFGQKLEYEDGWAGRYQAIKTDLKSVNLNANIARKVSDSLSLGFGVNAQYVDLDMSQKVFTGPGNPDSDASLKADSWGYGFNVGLLAELTKQTHFGFSYRSEVVQNARGEAKMNGAHLSDISSDVTLPATAMLSLNHQLGETWHILADVSWTGWSAYDELLIEYDDLGVNKGTGQGFNDSMRYSLGMMYDLNDQWRLRTGVAFDETPVPDAEHRSPRTPDSNKTWLSGGFNYAMSQDVSLDVGYSHLFADKAEINKADTALSGVSSQLVGEYETSVDIFSAQLVWNY